MIRNYLIANLYVKLNSESKYFHNLFNEYETTSDKVDMEVDLDFVSEIKEEGEVELEREIVHVRRNGDLKYAYYYHANELYGAIAFNQDYSKSKVLIVNKDIIPNLSNNDIAYMLFGMIFNYFVTFHDGIVLHSSAIKFKNSAIVFSAPSGVGKSTQTSMWLDIFKDEVTMINDDKPVLRFIGDELICFGSPFSGKNHLNKNDSAPIKAIINVVRDKVDHIEKLSIKEGLVLLLEETNRSLLNKQINTNNFKIMNKILTTIPIYRLYCTPTANAVETTYNELKETLN